MILNPTNESSQQVILIGGGGGDDSATSLLINGDGSNIRHDWNANNIYTSSIQGINNLIEMGYTSGGIRTLQINTNFVSDSPGTRTQNNLGNTIGNNANNYFIGTLSELIVFNRSLTQPERDQVQGYLVWKWGVAQAQLPSTNPFYTIPPQMAPAAKGAQGSNGGISAQGVSSFAGFPVPVVNPIQGSFGLGADAAYSISTILTGGGGGGGYYGGGGGVFGAGGGGDSLWSSITAFSTVSTIGGSGILPGYYQLASTFQVAEGGSLLSNGQNGFVFLTWQSTIGSGRAPVVNYEALQVYKDALFTSTVIIENSINLSTSVLTADSNTLYLNGTPVGGSFFNTLFIAL
jgi:hypothetical protein